jgi:hypothetical protein
VVSLFIENQFQGLNMPLAGVFIALVAIKIIAKTKRHDLLQIMAFFAARLAI